MRLAEGAEVGTVNEIYPHRRALSKSTAARPCLPAAKLPAVPMMAEVLRPLGELFALVHCQYIGCVRQRLGQPSGSSVHHGELCGSKILDCGMVNFIGTQQFERLLACAVHIAA